MGLFSGQGIALRRLPNNEIITIHKALKVHLLYITHIRILHSTSFVRHHYSPPSIPFNTTLLSISRRTKFLSPSLLIHNCTLLSLPNLSPAPTYASYECFPSPHRHANPQIEEAEYRPDQIGDDDNSDEGFECIPGIRAKRVQLVRRGYGM